jgi:hypothetical protein
MVPGKWELNTTRMKTRHQAKTCGPGLSQSNKSVSVERDLSLCVGILEIETLLVIWRFSDLGTLELYIL